MARTIKFNLLKNDNIECGYCVDMLEDLKQDYTIIEGDTFSVTVNDYEGKYIALFGETTDFQTTPIIYTTIDNVDYSSDLFENNRPYTDPKFYFSFTYYEEHYQTNTETIEIRKTDGTYLLIPIASVQGDVELNLDCGGKSGGIDFEDNDISNAVGIYKINNDKLNGIIADRHYLVEIGEYGEIYDKTRDILKIYKSPISNLPFNNEEIIRVSGNTLNITGQITNKLTVEYETEKILLRGYYGNSLDNDTVIKAIIPFYGTYEIDSKYINHYIQFKFSTNLMNNTTICYILIDDIMIDDITIIIGYDLPYVNNNVNQDISNNKFKTDFYITFEDKISVSDITDTLKQNTTLSNEIENNNLIGFVKSDLIDTSNFTDIPKDDIDKIISLMQSYIII